MQKNVQSLTQFTSNPFLIVGYMMSKNTTGYSASCTHTITISVHKCHLPDLNFKLIMESNFRGTLLLRSLKWSIEKVLQTLCKKAVLNNFAKFTGKHLCRSLCLNKVEKETPTQVFFCKNTFFTERLVETAYVFYWRKRNILFTLSWKEQSWYDILLSSY